VRRGGRSVGGWRCGWWLLVHVKDGKLHYTHSYVSTEFFTVSSKDAVPEGWHKLRFEFDPTGEPDFAAGKGSPGFFQLYFDGTLVGSLDVPHTGFTGYNP
jgi:arylsulfatase